MRELPNLASTIAKHEEAATRYADRMVEVAYHQKPTSLSAEWWHAMRETMREMLRMAFLDGACAERDRAYVESVAKERN